VAIDKLGDFAAAISLDHEQCKQQQDQVHHRLARHHYHHCHSIATESSRSKVKKKTEGVAERMRLKQFGGT
jgi:hypothetical protein